MVEHLTRIGLAQEWVVRQAVVQPFTGAVPQERLGAAGLASPRAADSKDSKSKAAPASPTSARSLTSPPAAAAAAAAAASTSSAATSSPSLPPALSTGAGAVAPISILSAASASSSASASTSAPASAVSSPSASASNTASGLVISEEKLALGIQMGLAAAASSSSSSAASALVSGRPKAGSSGGVGSGVRQSVSGDVGLGEADDAPPPPLPERPHARPPPQIFTPSGQVIICPMHARLVQTSDYMCVSCDGDVT